MAKDVPEVRAIGMIGAPADAVHLLKNFGTSLKEIKGRGSGHLK
jgi:hypothetical protein